VVDHLVTRQLTISTGDADVVGERFAEKLAYGWQAADLEFRHELLDERHLSHVEANETTPGVSFTVAPGTAVLARPQARPPQNNERFDRLTAPAETVPFCGTTPRRP
jgi:hypothetical protein